MITNFQQVTLGGRKSGKCKCGKRLTRQTTFMQTINPFNKNAQGEIKQYHEIMQELEAERANWLAKPVEHGHRGYWTWTKEQQADYDKGKATVEMSCGFPVEVINPKPRPLETNQSTASEQRIDKGKNDVTES